MSELTKEQWERIGDALRAYFDPKDVDFRVQGKAGSSGKVQALAYVDARAVQDRLDKVVGPGNWSFDWEPTVIDKGEVVVAKGILTIHGVVKADAGSASNFEQSMGAVSHCFKRAAVHWGIGRYLYDLGGTSIDDPKSGRIPWEIVRELRAKLPRPGGSAAHQSDEGGREEGQTTERSVQPTPRQPAAAPRPVAPNAADDPATEQQMQSIHKHRIALGKPETDDAFTYNQARSVIITLSGEYRAQRDAKASA